MAPSVSAGGVLSRSRRALGSASAYIVSLLDRSDPKVRSAQDAAFNLGLFVSAVIAIHKWGHKLAV
jgi:hypothetical protein